MNSDNINLGKCVSYGIGNFSYNFLYIIISSYLTLFYTDVFGIAPMAVSTLVLVCRAFDAINDPIIGMIADKTQTKQGRFRPWVLLGGIAFCIVTVLTFWAHPAWQAQAKNIYMYVTYLLLTVAMTAFYVPYISLPAMITGDFHGRARLAAVSQSFANVGNVLGLLLFSFLLMRLSSFSADKAYIIIIVIFAVIALPGFVLTFAKTRETVALKHSKKISLKNVYTVVKGNSALLVVFAGMFLYGFAVYSLGTIGVYYYTYVVGNAAGYAGYGTICMLSCSVAACFAPKILRVIPNKGKACTVCVLIYGLLRIPLYWVTPNNALLFGLLVIVGSAGGGLFFALIYGMLADVADLSEYKTGIRADGIIDSLSSFCLKLGNAIGTSILLAVLAKVGYQANAVQSEVVLKQLSLMWSIYPGILIIIVGLLFLIYKMDYNAQKKIREELDKRNLAE